VSTRDERFDFGAGLGVTGPLGELAREITALKADPEQLAAFVAELPGLSEVLRKYRPTSGVEPLAEPGALLDDARELLLARLAELEGA
jgi:hypothetical protein